jgi:hypothetical protein
MFRFTNALLTKLQVPQSHSRNLGEQSPLLLVRLTVYDPHNEPPDDLQSSVPGGMTFSMLGEIFIPLAAAAVPAALFRVVGLLVRDFDKPGIEMPTSTAVAMGIVQILGIVSMAVVVLWRGDQNWKRLMFLSDGQPQLWRRYCLRVSLVCLFLFDIFSNLMAAFSGTEILVFVAVPFFITYVIFNLSAFAGLKPTSM